MPHNVTLYMVRFNRVLVPNRPNPRRSQLGGLETEGFDDFHGLIAKPRAIEGHESQLCMVSHAAAKRTTCDTCGRSPDRHRSMILDVL